MKRFAILTVVATFILSTPLLLAQPAPQAPAQKAKFIPPVKGFATVDVQRVSSKRVGKEIQTVLKVKNTSKGSINLLRIEQYWYSRDMKQVSFVDYRHKKAPIQPGEVVEITLSAPNNPQISHDSLIFSHANGKTEARQVKKIE
jgi:hypothetical protein